MIKIIENKKRCSKCDEILDLSNFRKMPKIKCGYRSSCKKCDNKQRRLYLSKMTNDERRNKRKKEAIKNSHGIDIQEYNNMQIKQNNKCLICGKEESMKLHSNIKFLCVNHCHDSGKIRGLLCNSCNVGLGCFKDNIELIEKALDYLKNNIGETL